jgi:2-amino-4-hydroxy-6-hydroxymethyldihydropteridine diphosphokinase
VDAEVADGGTTLKADEETRRQMLLEARPCPQAPSQAGRRRQAGGNRTAVLMAGTRPTTGAFVGLGANLDDPVAQIERALVELDAIGQTRVTARSALYRTDPVGFAAQPAFVNAVACLQTSLDARALLEAMQDIEDRHGRQRTFANAPRTLDLDLLLYDDERVTSAALTLPHPRMHERAFVLVPLAEIAPMLSIPGQGTVQALLEHLDQSGVERIRAA